MSSKMRASKLLMQALCRDRGQDRALASVSGLRIRDGVHKPVIDAKFKFKKRKKTR